MIQPKKALNTLSSACLSGQALELIIKSWIHSMALAILVLCGSLIHATVLSWPGRFSPYTSIQNRDQRFPLTQNTVLVYPGRYYENVRFNGRKTLWQAW
jgi:1-deoxy-D-xylulose 5-phosphate reductoisomerase